MDAGCGSGRDSKAFLDNGYYVLSFDASKEMCRRAAEYIGREVMNLSFEEMDFKNEFDGVWVCASLLHVPMDDLPGVMKKIYLSLKKNGVIYASFKYGNGMTVRGERQFSDFTEKSIISLFETAGFQIINVVVGGDSRLGRENEKWVNVLGMSSGGAVCGEK